MTRASPSSTGRPPGRRCSAPSASRTTVTARAASCAALAGGGSRWSSGKAASPRSQIRVRASTNAGPAGEVEGDELPGHVGEIRSPSVEPWVAPGASRRPSCRAMCVRIVDRTAGREPLGRRGAAADAAGRGRAGGPRCRVRGRGTVRSRGGEPAWRSSSASPCRSASTTPTTTPTACAGPTTCGSARCGWSRPGWRRRRRSSGRRCSPSPSPPSPGLVLAASTSWWLLARRRRAASPRRGATRAGPGRTATSASARCSCSCSSASSPRSGRRTSASRRSPG